MQKHNLRTQHHTSQNVLVKILTMHALSQGIEQIEFQLLWKYGQIFIIFKQVCTYRIWTIILGGIEF